ncbi:MAG TPA: hypothetical protein VIL97_04400 [Thermoanaerobaculia bacterium]
MERVDAAVLELARRLGAEEQSYPARIARETLERVENFTSFPGQAIPDGEGFMPPAVCYHTYELLRNVRLQDSPYVVTARNLCARHEQNYDDVHLREFTMREIVFFGAHAEVEKIRKQLIRGGEAIAASLGLDAEIAVATDAFFLGTSRGKALLQRIKKLKLELRVGGIPLASFNHHEDFFGRRMQIRLQNGEVAQSGCAAFGLERWAHAPR